MEKIEKTYGKVYNNNKFKKKQKRFKTKLNDYLAMIATIL